MAYTVPSVLVYQQLANAGGVANLSPDLNAVLVGPAKNVVDFVPGDLAALSKSRSVTFNYANDASGQHTAPATTTFQLPSTKPGQVLDAASVQVWFYNTLVETHTWNVAPTAASDLITVTGATTADTTAGGEPKFKVGDTVVLMKRATGVVNPTNDAVVTTIVAIADSATIRVANIYTLDALLSGATDMEVRIYRNFNSLQATAGVATTNLGTTGGVVTHASLTSVHGNIVAGEVHVEYTALRTDLVGIIDVENLDDAEAKFGNLTDKNPLGLASKLALANTITSVKAVAVDENNLEGYLAALDLLEGDELAYSLVPLTQEEAITAAFGTHVTQMSTPVEAAWRIALINTAIPETDEIGGTVTSASTVDLGGGVFAFQKVGGGFLAAGYRAGDEITATGGVTGTFVIDQVLNDDQIKVVGTVTVASGVSFTVTRDLSKADKALLVRGKSEAYNNKRVVHVQPDLVGVEVDGSTKYVPGYYLCAALAGAIAGFPVQQGLTNISLAGITDLKNSNFYFTRNQLNLMAEKGTCLFVQVAPGSAPYCRHELTTDMSVLAYREILKVKNLDYLSKYFYDILKPFIGSWNITDDTLNIMRQTIVAACEQLKGRKLPRIGAPLVGYNLVRLEQNAVNKDNVDIELEVAIADPNNYTNLYLIV